MLLRLLPCMARELFLGQNFIREPEPDMLMDDHSGAVAYDIEGKEGVLLGVYYYQIIQMCGLIKAGDTVIDLGCGPCNLLCVLAQLNPESQFIGVDLSEEMLTLANKNIQEKNIHNIKLIKQDATNIKEIASGSVDVAISSMAIHHLPNKELLTHLFIEISRILKSEKRVYLYDFGKAKRTETIDFFLNTVTNNFVKEDYRNSLKAAFELDDFKYLTQKHLGEKAQVFSTLIVPMIVVIKSASHPLTDDQTRRLKLMIELLNTQQRNDFNMLKLFLRMSGMRSLL
ncbi:class I SAM-dependent methyltransferase [Klebsiella michiganensis]|uniref:Class I SAM-dependent methyltransferase n=1 Tax=Klebsiella michiganensis TaxID=1134687 RepID=A0A6P1V0F4_9ENTR|nr:class I SAM-dependent methyltransferase [Klebsiella michiganensis]QHS47550.1 class I SAM-dependent methyltransferase [Klebsiella michiganensis]